MNWSVLWLDVSSIPRSLELRTWGALMVFSALAIAAMHVPDSTLSSVALRMIVVGVGSLVALLLLFALCRRLGASISWNWFSIPPVYVLFASSLFGLFLHLLSLALESSFLIHGMSAFIQSLTPYYILASFGGSVYQATQLRSPNALIMGAVAVFLLSVVMLAADAVL